MLEQRRNWIRDEMALYEYKQLPKKVEEFYLRQQVGVPLT
jgi:hypothetical protein